MCIILTIVLTLPDYLKSSLSTLAMVNNISNHCLLSPPCLYQFVLYFPFVFNVIVMYFIYYNCFLNFVITMRGWERETNSDYDIGQRLMKMLGNDGLILRKSMKFSNLSLCLAIWFHEISGQLSHKWKEKIYSDYDIASSPFSFGFVFY